MWESRDPYSPTVARHVGVVPLAEGSASAGGGPGTSRSTEDLAAYNEYFHGRHNLAALSPEGLTNARQHFEKAIARDPNLALAYDSLAEVYWWFGYFGFTRPIDAFSAGVLYAVRALEIENRLAETHALLTQYHKQTRLQLARRRERDGSRTSFGPKLGPGQGKMCVQRPNAARPPRRRRCRT